MARKKAIADVEKQALLKELSSEARRANAKLQQLQGSLGTKETYAGKQLLDRLNTEKIQGLTSKGFVKFNKDMNLTQIRAILKATKSFNQSKTSSVRGIREVKENTINSLGITFDVTEKEAESIYNFLGSQEYISNEIEYIKSEIIVAAEDTKEKNGDLSTFIRQLRSLGVDYDLANSDLQDDLVNIYNKYFK